MHEQAAIVGDQFGVAAAGRDDVVAATATIGAEDDHTARTEAGHVDLLLVDLRAAGPVAADARDVHRDHLAGGDEHHRAGPLDRCRHQRRRAPRRGVDLSAQIGGHPGDLSVRALLDDDAGIRPEDGHAVLVAAEHTLRADTVDGAFPLDHEAGERIRPRELGHGAVTTERPDGVGPVDGDVDETVGSAPGLADGRSGRDVDPCDRARLAVGHVHRAVGGEQDLDAAAG